MTILQIQIALLKHTLHRTATRTAARNRPSRETGTGNPLTLAFKRKKSEFGNCLREKRGKVDHNWHCLSKIRY